MSSHKSIMLGLGFGAVALWIINKIMQQPPSVSVYQAFADTELLLDPSDHEATEEERVLHSAVKCLGLGHSQHFEGMCEYIATSFNAPRPTFLSDCQDKVLRKALRGQIPAPQNLIILQELVREQLHDGSL